MLARGGREASQPPAWLNLARRLQPARITVSGPSLFTFSCASQSTRARFGAILTVETFVAVMSSRSALGADGVDPQSRDCSW